MLDQLSSAAMVLLSTFATDPNPWLHIEANSDQRQPLYFGGSPKELELGSPSPDLLSLSSVLKSRGEAQVKLVRSALKKHEPKIKNLPIQFEAWPIRDDEGRLTWAFARWRREENDPWQWIPGDKLEIGGPDGNSEEPALFIPSALHPWKQRDASQIFDDFLLSESLYAKPVFGECVWSNEAGDQVIGAWFSLDQLEYYRKEFTESRTPGRRSVCQVISQPPRFKGRPFTLVIESTATQVHWPEAVNWTQEPAVNLQPISKDPRVQKWPSNFESLYKQDVLTLDGEIDAVFPLSRKKIRFKRKNPADARNQLIDFVSYLEERYAQLGIQSSREEFMWREIPQSNLIAVIPGSLPKNQNHPVLIADHIDTAFSEDEFDQNGKRVSAPGADDNVSAVAALLRAAEILKDSKPQHDIWLVHLTGEEYPADCLGARHLVSRLLSEGRELGGLVLMDMIAYNADRGNLFQISAGDSSQSLQMARVAIDAAHDVAGHLLPLIRTRFDSLSYLYNTDGLVFSDAGYPVILLNEHLNYLENLDRPHYHQTSDRSDTLDWSYGTSIVKVAIETAARLAEVK